MKTNKEWYEQYLPKGIAEKAVANAVREGTIDFDENSLKHAIECGFSWRDSEEGRNYWLSIVNRIIRSEFDKPITEPKLPSIPDTIKILMDYAKQQGFDIVISLNERHTEPLPGEESRIDLSTKNNK